MAKKIWIGAHTSAAGGPHNALYEGQTIGATTIQLFTSNQKQWHGKVITKEQVELWEKAIEETGIDKIMSHDSYLINLGSPNPELLAKSKKAFEAELQRCHLLNISYLNFHPGASTSGSVEQCLDQIGESLIEMEELAHKGKTRLLLETTAGQGTSVGHTFEQIHYIIEKTHHKIPIGVCIDTCHIFAAGYDIHTQKGWNQTLKEFDEIIGLEYLCAFHLNDSQKKLGSHVDRHANLGEGEIGMDAFEFLMTSPLTKDLPKYLETPGGPTSWKKEIAHLKTFAENL
jgi:deoxyribonuclease-4